MGKEAICSVQWADESARCEVVLESNELIVRGPLKHKVPLASISKIEVIGKALHFKAGAETVALILGSEQAQLWAKKIAAPPPTLATKLGIRSAMQLFVIGEFSAPELASAIAEAASLQSQSPDLMLAVVKNTADLDHTIDLYAAFRTRPPIWMIYAKGANKPIGETEIRTTLRHQGFMDIKVASVSPTLTALKFIKRQGMGISRQR